MKPEQPPTKELIWDPAWATPEERREMALEITRPKLLEIEVHWRTWKAAKANPGSVRIIVEDEEGVKIVERPYRPRNIRMEPDGDRVDFKRHMIRRVG
jgi:hypothetical protein